MIASRFAFRLYLAVFFAVAETMTGQIIVPTEKIERVFAGGYLTEGPAVAPDGRVFFSDQTFTSETGMQAGILWCFDPGTGQTTVYRSPSGMSNGIDFDAQGNMLVAEGADFGGRRITRTDLRSGKSTILAGLFQGTSFNSPNDLTIDEQGRIYFTDPRYVGHEPIEQQVNGVYRVDTNGTVSLVINDISMPNGICISPDQKTLYIGCNDEGTDSANGGRPPRMAIYAYDLHSDGTVSFRSIFKDYKTSGGPDGITVDREGNLFVAVTDEERPGIYVYSATGEAIDRIPTPEIPSNVAFGRDKNDSILYITAGKSLYRIRTNTHGYHLPTKK